MKFIKLVSGIILSFVIADSTFASTINYQNTDEEFPNPERGFYTTYHVNNGGEPLNVVTGQHFRNKNITLIMRIYNISQFRNGDLSQDFLDLINKDCEAARKSGIKLIVSFIYNFESGGQDASKERILSHLDRLQPILNQNQDVIALMTSGFIGNWGEWHNSTNGLDKTEDRKDILFKILSVLPQARMVALRYPHHKMEIFNNTNPLTREEAFNGTYRARTGAANYCFLADNNDSGTYDYHNPEQTKTFLASDNQYVLQGGETCATSAIDDCPNALQDLQRMHWSFLNSTFEMNVLNGWEAQGCMPEIKRRLGYRFRLLNSSIPDKLKPGGTFSMSFEVTNDGWASPYNPHSLEVILRNSKTGVEYYLPVAESVRMWMPGENKPVNIVGGIPSDLPSGEYQVLLNIPDPAPSLYNRPEYSIRLANQNVWEQSTGYNSLMQTVVVDLNAEGERYSGNQFFKQR